MAHEKEDTVDSSSEDEMQGLLRKPGAKPGAKPAARKRSLSPTSSPRPAKHSRPEPPTEAELIESRKKSIAKMKRSNSALKDAIAIEKAQTAAVKQVAKQYKEKTVVALEAKAEEVATMVLKVRKALSDKSRKSE